MTSELFWKTNWICWKYWRNTLQLKSNNIIDTSQFPGRRGARSKQHRISLFSCLSISRWKKMTAIGMQSSSDNSPQWKRREKTQYRWFSKAEMGEMLSKRSKDLETRSYGETTTMGKSFTKRDVKGLTLKSRIRWIWECGHWKKRLLFKTRNRQEKKIGQSRNVMWSILHN